MIIALCKKIFHLIVLLSLCGCAKTTVNDIIDGISIHRLPQEVVSEVVSSANKELFSSLARYNLKSDTILKADDFTVYPALGDIYFLKTKVNLIGKGSANLLYVFKITEDEKQMENLFLQYIQQGDLIVDEVLFFEVFKQTMQYQAIQYQIEKNKKQRNKKNKQQYKLYANYITAIGNSNECIWYSATEERIKKFKIIFNRKPAKRFNNVFFNTDPVHFTFVELENKY